jgi:hypothetical protein
MRDGKLVTFISEKLTDLCNNLRKVCGDRGLKVTDYDNLFFQFHDSPGSLRGDQRGSSSSASTSASGAEAAEEEDDGVAEALDDDGGYNSE